jgi:excinuclease ABC subunit C
VQHNKRWSAEVEEFRGFGRSEFWPFRGRLKSLAIGEDFADVRRSLRDCCPARAGVYGMIDSGRRLIYVGMSIALRKRLVTYFQGGAAIRKECRIAGDTDRLVWEVVGHELAAQLRELELIRRHQPRFNVKGRQPDRPLGYIYISREDAPRVRTGRRVPKGVRYAWGPLVINWRIKESLEVANRYFKLSDCPASVPMHFADQGSLFSLDLRPECLRHEMGTCLGPCAGECTRTQYLAQLRAAQAFLDGRNPAPLAKLEHALHDAAQLCQFERAASLRDRLERLQYLHDRLEMLREPALPARFVYPVNVGRRQAWYFLADGRVVGGSPIPISGEEAEKCLRRLRRAYRLAEGVDVTADRPARQIVSAWFRTNRDHLQTILSPDEAEQFCRHLQVG